MLKDTNTLADLLRDAGVRLYRHESTDATRNAQDNLRGRTFYAEPDTLRWHKARILNSRDIWCGAGLMVVESVSLDWDNTKRGYRFAVFDVFGNVVERADLENTWKTADGARKAFWKWLAESDPFTHYLSAIESRARNLDRESASLRNAALCINNPTAIKTAA